ncbi:MAG: valyl-tRNA synthetase [Chthonomonadaceae bacterium]|nr:valyl-tRNA synthetase [Chthonomonadaceae bacterium]
MTDERPELAKAYDPKLVEKKWYSLWKERGYFHAEPDPNKTPYCITIPPPNITGSLHMGHALNNSILDTMTRWHRMRGFSALCLPGTDHAGIATQNVVERTLAAEGLTRHDLGREKFIERCWEWREQYGTRIYYQFEKLGCSYDWERVRFTLDESYVDAIMEEFRSWYERGLIYRGTRVVNWDVKFQSAVSDIEVEMQERKGKLYHFRYPFADGSGYITIATTRPETMLGDAAVAANPSDERYQPHFGKMLRLPLTDREIPLIADDYAKPEFGSGAVKVTPAHDLNDFECGQRHNLPQHIVIGKDGTMTPLAGPDYEGMDRFAARKKVVADMEALGLVEKIEDYTIQTPISERSKEVIEPLLSEQWFVDMKPLAAPAIEIVQQNKIHFVPDRYKDMYLRWMENIRPWCISRQLWWGHRIPVWWTEAPAEDGTTGRRHCFARTKEQAEAALGTHDCWQDEDVLDTWFSSALWPHATLGWPQNTADLAYFYPTNLLSTAQEILYLWVSRMIMTGLDFIKRADAPEEDGMLDADGKTRSILPFRDVYVHATVLDEKGERMSKSKGNGIDPIDLIEKYGADATRFSLLQQAGKNQDIKYSEQRTDLAGNFCNKLWNASRFVLMNLDAATTGELPDPMLRTVPDRWILSRLDATIQQVNGSLATYDMDDASRALYTFFWDDFCDWYVEMAKPRLRGTDEEKSVAQNMLAFVLETTLRLLHPMIPFITEEIWQSLPHQGENLIIASYPTETSGWLDTEAEAAMSLTIATTRAIRNMKMELNIPPGTRLTAAALPGDTAAQNSLAANAELIASLARLNTLDIVTTAPGTETGKWIATPVVGAEIYLEIGDALDIGKETERIEKELAAVVKQIERSENQLNNPNFVQRAAPERVAEERQRLAEWEAKKTSLEERKRLFTA